ncbi:MAG TPA: HhH-GPD-type base excision DNA repair protein [Acidimicrobiales bacterium]|jgi:uncharacterized HhH-GPD family protein|nr:HhH-GPD-type base excision DNA repair protein [Acidimicrobiales bacterium]
MNAKLPITGNPDADRLLEENPLALLIGMLLDQQVPMEWAFSGPYTLQQRLGGLDAARIAAMDPDEFLAVCKGPPAVHRFPGSMGKRVQALAQAIVDDYDGNAEAIWRDVETGDELHHRLIGLPGYGEEKTRIFIALLAKRFDVRPKGWEEAAGPFGDDTPRSVADIDSPETLARVRQWKQARKAAGRSKAD